ncbi:MAG: nucleotide exchange factor GrpE [Sulfurovaceae bacterium]|nr:nucleotide exchange factor GrpE [Sulfurovaceae bacterium]
MSQEEKEILENTNESVDTGQSQEEMQVDEVLILQNELQEYKDKYLRAYADFENTKKRLEKDKITAVNYANTSFAKDVLSVMDSFDGAVSSIDTIADSEDSPVLQKIKEGILNTHEQLKKVLEKHGIIEIECEGCFNPEVHQAIMQVESDAHENGAIVQVLQKGYTIKDQVLRPAMVSTAKK